MIGDSKSGLTEENASECGSDCSQILSSIKSEILWKLRRTKYFIQQYKHSIFDPSIVQTDKHFSSVIDFHLGISFLFQILGSFLPNQIQFILFFLLIQLKKYFRLISKNGSNSILRVKLWWCICSNKRQGGKLGKSRSQVPSKGMIFWFHYFYSSYLL